MITLRETIPPRSIGWVLVTVLAAGLPLCAAVEDDARQAWDAGDHALALTLYERVLEDQPDNFLALLRSAKLLSWTNRFAASIERYDRALAVRPDDREAALGRATVLSWDGRYRQSRAGFEALLRDDPDDVDARLGLARSYAWAARIGQARAEYTRVLDVDPGNTDAKIGLAYLDLWSGEIGLALAQAEELEAREPDHEEVLQLHTNVAKSAGAWWTVDIGQTDDTDDNRLRRYLVRGGLGLGRQVRLELGAGRYTMADPAGDTSIDAFDAVLSVRPRKGQRASAHLGVDHRTGLSGASDSDVLGGLSYVWGLDRRWQASASALRIPIRYSPIITDNGITFDQVELRTSGAVGERFRVSAGLSTADFSDGNGRQGADAGFLYRVPVRRVTLHAGYTLRWMDYDSDLANGYFDPQGFVAHLAQLRIGDEYGNRGNYYRAYVDAGVQSFQLGAVDVSGDTVYVVGATAGFPVSRRLTLEAYADHGDYAATTASGFESTTLGLRLLWRAGY